MAHVKATGHTWCHCGGPAFAGGLTKHRPGSRYCQHHPYGHVHLAERYGATEDEIIDMILEVVLEKPHTAQPSDLIPF